MRKLMSTMRDFSGGQINAACLRSDETPQYRTSAREMSDWMVETTGTLVPRPGRRLIARTNSPRMEYARVGSTDYSIAFDTQDRGRITIYDRASATIVARQLSSVYAWTMDTLADIYFCVCDFQIVVCYPGMRPQLAIRAAVDGSWTFGQFDFRISVLQSQQPFVRTGLLGATMKYDAFSGTTNLTCSAPFFTRRSIGRLLSILGQQVTITDVSSPTQAVATIMNRLPDFITFVVNKAGPFLAGQIVQVSGASSNSYEVIFVEPFPDGTAYVHCVALSDVVDSYAYNNAGDDRLVSEMGSAKITNAIAYTEAGETGQWQEQFMGDGIGWPSACAYDRSRLIFHDFPQKPEAILWSAVGAYDTFWVDPAAARLQPDAGTLPNDAILEYIPGGPRVRHVIGWGDEFAFTDKGIFNIPISASSNPLKPGSVEFRQFSNDGCTHVKPQTTIDSVLFVNAGGKRVSAVIRTGAQTDPYTSDGVSDFYTDLFTDPVTLAVAPGDGSVPQRLAYVLNADGSIVLGRFSADRKLVGWIPWSSGIAPSWLFCSGPDVFYCLPLAGGWWLAQEDTSLYLDAVVTPNAPPASFPPGPGGSGALFMFAGQPVTVMNGPADLGDTTVDAGGSLVVPPGVDGTAPGLAVGVLPVPKLTPFVPDGQPGESIGQRQHRRKITRVMARTQNASGFMLGSRSVRPGIETAQARPQGRDFDPGCRLSKPRPGPLRVVEVTTEATV